MFGTIIRNSPGGMITIMLIGRNTSEAFETEEAYDCLPGKQIGFVLSPTTVANYPSMKIVTVIGEIDDGWHEIEP